MGDFGDGTALDQRSYVLSRGGRAAPETRFLIGTSDDEPRQQPSVAQQDRIGQFLSSGLREHEVHLG